jgi:hypothetical protein
MEETISKEEPLPVEVQIERCLQEFKEGKIIKFDPETFLKD